MLYCYTILLLAARLVAGELDEELHAKYLTMPRHKFIQYFNQQNYSYSITDYGDDVITSFGAHINYEKYQNLPVQTHDVSSFKDLPVNFDSRDKWSQCATIKEIYDQGACGSCWTFGTATSASDRTCIHKNIQVRLSEQDFNCMQQYVCGGGEPSDAFEFWQKRGLVTQECKPYNITELKEGGCTTECVNKEIDYVKDKHYAEKVYAVRGDSIDNIKTELFQNGPIQAVFSVYSDLIKYSGGIYIHTHGDYAGLHSVRVIGYGVENKVQYWLVANSWGTAWGEKGFFRVKAYESDLGFESYLVAGIPKS